MNVSKDEVKAPHRPPGVIGQDRLTRRTPLQRALARLWIESGAMPGLSSLNHPRLSCLVSFGTKGLSLRVDVQGWPAALFPQSDPQNP